MGAKADTLFALILDPKSDEYLSLISIVYCGKSREDLLSSQEAVEAQIKLQTVLKHTASRLFRRSYWDEDDRGSPSHVGSQNVREGALSPKAAFHLDGIRIRLAEEEHGDTSSSKSVERVAPSLEKVLSSRSVERNRKSGVKTSPRSVEGVTPSCLRSTSDTSGGRPLQQEESTWMWFGHGKKKAGKVIPREWYVLSYPLPEVTSVPLSLLASLKESVKESHFHESIYYSKKKVS